MMGRSIVRLRSIGWTLCTVLVLGAGAVLGGAVIAHRFTTIEFEPAGSHTIVAVWTPIGTFPIGKNASLGRSLVDVIYPGSVLISRQEKYFYRGLIGQEAKFAQLVVYRYGIAADQPVLTDWYRAKLGPRFEQCSAWPCGNFFQDENWAALVNDMPVSPILTFQQNLGDRFRGVQLTKEPSTPDAVISIYDFQLHELP